MENSETQVGCRRLRVFFDGFLIVLLRLVDVLGPFVRTPEIQICAGLLRFRSLVGEVAIVLKRLRKLLTYSCDDSVDV